jgi:hypothetical protein
LDFGQKRKFHEAHMRPKKLKSRYLY